MTHEDRIAGILGAWQDARDEGRFVNPESIYADHPDLADELRLRFAALNVVEQAYAESRMFDGDAPKRLGEFQIIRELGRGGMGVVYEAVQTSMRRTVALKVLFPSVTSSRRAIDRFQREAHAAGRVQHTNIVPVYGLSREAGTWYYAMEMVQGVALSSLLRQLRDLGDEAGAEHRTLIGARPEPQEAPSGSLADETASQSGEMSTQFTEAHGSAQYHRDVARLFADVADALQAAHDAGVVHRDIKPSNLILDEKGVLKIVDFGIARIGSEASGMTVTGEILGTPIYMSPEQARARAGEIDHRTDIYSLGASLYEVLTLRPPFKGGSFPEVYEQILTTQPIAPRRHSGAIPRDLETIVTKAMEKDPSQRFATAGDLARDLRDFAAGATIRARRIGALGRGWRVVKRHRVRSVLAVCTLIALAIATYLGVQSGQERERLRNMEYASLFARAQGAMARKGQMQGDAVAPLGPRAAGAIALLDRAIALMPDRHEAWLARALAAGRSIDQRLADIEAARARGLSLRTTLLARAAIREAAGQHEAAALDRAGVEDAGVVTMADRHFEGLMLVRRGEYESGIKLLSAALSDEEGTGVLVSLAHFWRAFAREMTGDLAGALEDLARLPKLEVGATLNVEVRMAALWWQLGQRDRAQASFDDLLARAQGAGSTDGLRYLWAASDKLPAEWTEALAHAAVDLDDDQPWTLLLKAEQASRANEPRRALELVERALEKGAAFGHAHLFRARALQRLGRFEEARGALKRAAVLAGNYSGQLASVGAGFSNLGDSARALEFFERACALDPYRASYHGNRARALAQLVRFAEAEEALAITSRLAPRGAHGWAAHGNVWFLRGLYEEGVRGDETLRDKAYEKAVEGFTAASQLEPEESLHWSGLAGALNNLRRYETAIEAADRAIRFGDALGEGRYTKAFAMSRLRRYDEAEEVLRPLEDAGAGQAKVYMLRAHILADPALKRLHPKGGPVPAGARARLVAALTSITRVLELGTPPEQTEAHSLRAAIRMFLGLREKAVADYRRAAELEPGNGRVQFDLAQALAFSGEPKEALEILDRIRPGRSDSAEDWYLTSLCHRYLGHPKKAIAAGEAALRLRPTDVQTILNLAMLYGNVGARERRLAVLNEGLTRVGNSPILHANRGLCLAELGQHPEALEAFDHAIKLGLDPTMIQSQRSTSRLFVENPVELEQLKMAYKLYTEKRYARSARAFEAALKEPRIRRDLDRGHLYNAVCSAALASAGAKDEEALRLRRQAIDWLREDQRLRDAAIEKLRTIRPPPADLSAHEARYQQAREHARRNDTDLSSLRGLPEFQRLFEDVKRQPKAAGGGR